MCADKGEIGPGVSRSHRARGGGYPLGRRATRTPTVGERGGSRGGVRGRPRRPRGNQGLGPVGDRRTWGTADGRKKGGAGFFT